MNAADRVGGETCQPLVGKLRDDAADLRAAGLEFLSNDLGCIAIRQSQQDEGAAARTNACIRGQRNESGTLARGENQFGRFHKLKYAPV